MANGVPRPFELAGQYDSYVTLSHCWGHFNILTTTKGNLERHHDYSNLHLLPKTFQDAVKISSHLGIRCLWIDSLCIVQDDPNH